MNLPIVAIIGKPNVGKSTLFNLLVGRRKAVVAPTPGTTRDRHYSKILARKPFLLVDTGGMVSLATGDLQENIFDQATLAIAEAQLILFLIDAKEGMTSEDRDIAQMLRKKGKKVLLIASKSDSGRENIIDLLELGFGEPLRISAIHKQGSEELLKVVQKEIPKVIVPKKTDSTAVYIAILGRTNVGKSSLVNQLLREERCIVSPLSGTTVDSIDTELMYLDTPYILIDTAGLRRRGKIRPGFERYAVFRSLEATDRADVSVLLIDGVEGITSQDLHIVHAILERSGGLILAVNKLDLMEAGEEERSRFLHLLRHKFDFVPWAAVIFLSAKTGKNVEKILELAKEIKERRSQHIDATLLNRWLTRVTHQHMPASIGKRIPKLASMKQVGVNPPHFLITGRFSESLHFSYLRYLENKFRESFDFTGTAIRMEFRKMIKNDTENKV